MGGTLDILRRVGHIPVMKNSMRPSLAEIEASLATSEAQAQSGLTVPMASVLQRLRASIAHLEAKQDIAPSRRAMPRR